MSLRVKSKMTLKIGIVGFGSWGKRHFESWKNISNIEIVGVYDPVYKGETFFESLDELIRSAEALDIVVPAESLAVTGAKAINAGKHVFLEKPVATNVENAKHLARLAEQKTECFSMVGFIERFNPVFRKIKSIFDRDGNPTAIFCQRSGSPTLVATQAGVLKDLAIHDIDLLRWMLGEPKSVSVRSSRGFHFGEIELSFEKTKTLVISDCLGPKIRRWVATRDDSTLFAHFEGDRWRLLTKQGMNEEGVEIPIEWSPPLEEELRYFADCVATGKKPTPNIHDAVRALEIIEQAR
jgi:UDP-N-acetylglucosamine 3-dehydrogenase